MCATLDIFGGSLKRRKICEDALTARVLLWLVTRRRRPINFHLLEHSKRKHALKIHVRLNKSLIQDFPCAIFGSAEIFKLFFFKRIDHITSKSDPRIPVAREAVSLWEKTSGSGNGTCRVSPSPNRRRKLDSLCIAVYPRVSPSWRRRYSIDSKSHFGGTDRSPRRKK